MPDPKPCARCKVAPRNSSLKSYCVDCKRALLRESRKRVGVRPQRHCSRCGQIRDGRHPTYCRPCYAAWKSERLAGPCGRCGAIRVEGDRTNHAYCYDCWRGWWLRRKYGITADAYDRMLVEQDHRCAVCLQGANGRTWHVDHCHETGTVRGILCDNCNRGIGHLRDAPALLRRAAEYIERSRTPKSATT